MFSKEAFDTVLKSDVFDDKNARRHFMEKFNEICFADYPISFDIIQDAETHIYYLIPSDINKTEALPIEKINYIVCVSEHAGNMISEYIRKITTYAERAFGVKRPSRVLSEVFYGLYIHGVLHNFFGFNTLMPVFSADKSHIIKKENILYPVRYSPIKIDASELSVSRLSSVGIAFTELYTPDMDFDGYFNDFAKSVSYGQSSFGNMDSYSLPEYYSEIMDKAFSEVLEKNQDESEFDFEKAEYEIMSLGSQINADKHKENYYDYHTDKRRILLYEKVNDYMQHKGIDKISVFDTNRNDTLVIFPSFNSSGSKDVSEDIFKFLVFIDSEIYKNMINDIKKPSLKRVYFLSIVYILSNVSSHAPALLSSSRLDDIDFNIDDTSDALETIDINGYFDYETNDYRFDPNSVSTYERNCIVQDKQLMMENICDKTDITGIGFLENENGSYFLNVPVMIENRSVIIKLPVYDDGIVCDDNTGEFICNVYYNKDKNTDVFIHGMKHSMNIDDLKLLLYKASKAVVFVTGFCDIANDIDVFINRLYLRPDKSLFIRVVKDCVFKAKNGTYGVCSMDNNFYTYEFHDGAYFRKSYDIHQIRRILFD